MSTLDIIANFLLLFCCGCAMLLATIVMADVGGDWMEKQIMRLLQRWQLARRRVEWAEVARRHRRRVNI